MSDPSSAFDWGPALPTLGAERVELRVLREADAPAVYEIFSDLEVMRYWGTPPLEHESGALDLIRSIHAGYGSRAFFQWGIAERESDGLIGTVTLWKPDFDNRRSEIGFALHRSRWGRGLASEALRRAIEFFFDELGLNRLEADVDPRNAPSLALLERLGFQREGFMRERHYNAGEWEDTVWLALLRRDWE